MPSSRTRLSSEPRWLGIIASSKHENVDEQLARAGATTDSTIERLRLLIRGTFAFCGKDPRVSRLMFQTAYGPPVPEVQELLDAMTTRRFMMVVELMQAGLDRGELAGGDALSLALLFCSIMDHHALTLSRHPAATELLTAQRADASVDAFLHGMSPPPGVSQLSSANAADAQPQQVASEIARGDQHALPGQHRRQLPTLSRLLKG